MAKRTQAEIDEIIALAQKAWEESPKMPAEDAARLRAKWSLDSQSLTVDVFRVRDEQ